MRRWVSLAISALAGWAWAAPVGAAPPCPAERASYRLKSDPSFTARFVPALHHASAASRLYLRISAPHGRWWFVFGTAQGHGGLFVEPVTNPELASARETGPSRIGESGEDGPMAFVPVTFGLEVLPSAPQPGATAPDAFLLPELPARLWYAPESLSGDLAAKAVSLSQGFFVRTGCAAASGSAYP